MSWLDHDLIAAEPGATVVTKTVDTSSPSIGAGYAAMAKNGKLTLASSGNLPLGLYIAGIVLNTTAPGGSAQIITQGMIDPTTFNVGAGVACAVGLDTNGKPVRVTDAACVSGLKFVGVCDASGAIYVSPRNETEYVFTDFGFVGDGTTDNAAAWTALLAVIGNGDTFAPTAKARVRVPQGIFYFSAALAFSRTIQLVGAGMGAIADSASCAIVMPQGIGGIIADNNATAVASSFSTVEDVAFYGSGAVGSTRPSAWSPSHAYSAGDIVMPRYFDTTANSGSYPGGLMAWAWKCTTPGTSGATEPTWPVPVPPLGTVTQTDGGVTWTCVAAHGIEIRQGYVKVVRCRFYGFAGNGIHAVASTSWGSGWQSSGSTFTDNDCSLNGGNGIAIGGFDGNAIRCAGNTCRDNRGYGVHDRSGLGGVHIGGQCAGNIIGNWWGNSSTFVQPYSESGNYNVFKSLAQVLGGVWELAGDTVAVRQNNHTYAPASFMYPAAGGNFVFYTSAGGTTAGSEPDFTTHNGSPMVPSWNDTPQATITDGTVSWVCYGFAEVSDGLMLGHALPYPGVRPFIVNSPAGPSSVRVGLGALPSAFNDANNPVRCLTMASSDDSNFANPVICAWDASESRFYWTYTTSAGNRFMEFTTASASPEGQGQITFPNGIWTGNRALDALASSYFGPNKLRLSGDIDLHGGHYLGDREIARDGALTTDATTTTACAFTLPNDSTNGALTELRVKVLAKEFSTGSDCAVFELRGSWYRKDATVVQVAAPEVVYGKPTDATHCTAGATTWTAVLSLSGTSVNVQVTGANAHEIHWYVTRESDEGTRT